MAQGKSVMPPTPNAASIAKFVDQPVGHYTGIPKISIPLWSVNLKSYIMPIALNYHAGGIKVEEEASIVGLGWSLQAGGVVTRAVRDLPDDYRRPAGEKDILFGDGPETEYPRIGRFWTGKYEALRDFDFESSNKSYIWSTLDNIKTNYPAVTGSLFGYNDIEPDIFYFSFGNKSGKFVFDVSGTTQKVALIPYQDIVITHTLSVNGEITSFKILDNDGTEYLFDKVERLTRITGSQSNDFWRYPLGAAPPGPNDQPTNTNVFRTVYNSSWYLSQVKTVLGGLITFSYADESMWQYDRPGTGNITGKYINGVPYNVFNVEDGASNESTTKKRLIKIDTDKETINFVANHVRQDVYLTANAITSVEIISKASNIKIKSFDLSYSYFQSPTSEPINAITPFILPIPIAHEPVYYKRLRLDQVTEKGKNNEVNPPYQFTYDNNLSLPHRFSYQQDLWGYFNAASSNTNLFPTVYVYPGYTGSDRFRVYPTCNIYPDTDNYILPGGNRLPNAAALTTATINRITYPTGGYTDYIYEPHTFLYDNCTYPGGGIRIKSIKNYTAQNKLATEKSYSYLDTSGNNVTSGRIISMPVFADITIAQIRYYTSSRVVPGETNGSMVGYQSVTEKLVDSISNNGSVRYEYSMPAKHGENNDILDYDLYRISNVKWVDNVIEATYGPEGYQEFLGYKNAYHAVPNTSPFPPNPDYDWARGNLIKETYFNSLNIPVREVINTYKVYDAPASKGPKSVYGLSYRHIGYDYISFVSVLVYSKFELLTNRAIVPASKTMIEYQGAEISMKTEDWEYLQAGHMNPVKKTIKGSDGKQTILKFKYPWDYNSTTPFHPSILNMRVRNLTSIPIEELMYIKRNNQQTLVAGNFTLFGTGSMPLPVKHYQVETSAPLTTFYESYSEIDEMFFDFNYKEKESFNLYDIKGNILEKQNANDVKYAYIWDYQKNFPIAEVVNAAYIDIAYTSFESDGKGNWTYTGAPVLDNTAPTGSKSYFLFGNITKSGLNNSGKYTVSYWSKDGDITVHGVPAVLGRTVNGWTFFEHRNVSPSNGTITLTAPQTTIDELRLYPSNAMMTTYTHDPLIGITSKCDINNCITFYEYDGFSRLKVIRDQDRNIIKVMDYQFQKFYNQ